MVKYYVYIVGSSNGNSLYIGVTADLIRRVGEHKSGIGSSFTCRYRCTKLLYFEEYQNVKDAISREKQLKGWTRKKKEALIATLNPERQDLME